MSKAKPQDWPLDPRMGQGQAQTPVLGMPTTETLAQDRWGQWQEPGACLGCCACEVGVEPPNTEGERLSLKKTLGEQDATGYALWGHTRAVESHGANLRGEGSSVLNAESISLTLANTLMREASPPMNRNATLRCASRQSN